MKKLHFYLLQVVIVPWTRYFFLFFFPLNVPNCLGQSLSLVLV